MNTVIAVFRDIASYFSPTTKAGALRLLGLIVITIVVIRFIAGANSNTAEVQSQNLKVVDVATISSFSNTEALNLIGTVEAVNEADIQSEKSGRVTRVNTTLGANVSAGQVIAQLENASEYASLLQAEGAYDAALAAAAQSDIGVSQASIAVENATDAALATYRSAFTTFRSILLTDVDQVYSDPDGTTPGLKISAGGNTAFLNNERVAFEQLLASWQQRVNTASENSDLPTLLTEARTNTNRLIVVIDTLIDRMKTGNAAGVLTDGEIATLLSTFSADRATLNTTLSAIDGAKTTLSSAEESLRQAELGGTGADVSAANAAVKQALGSLRAAQANYNKTILRTPISGVVNALEIKTGDFVSSFTTVAIVANNNALEVTTFVGENDLKMLFVGQEAIIEGTFTGSVTNIAPAVNPQTKKYEVKIQTETDTIANGDTVSVSIVIDEEKSQKATALVVPITAVKFTDTAGSVFTVENDRLVEHEVTVGTIRNNTVVLMGGASADMAIVVDARGLTAGQEVSVRN